MTDRKYAVIAVAAIMMIPGLAMAENTVLSGMFDGSEAATSVLPGTCKDSPDFRFRPDLAYQSIGIQVSASGTYTVADSLGRHKMEIIFNLYQGSFNPDSPQTGLLTPLGVFRNDEISLSAGTDYTLVVQHHCVNQEGAWAVTFSGPGEVVSANVVTVPEWTEGVFSGDEPTADFLCEFDDPFRMPYQVTGPVQVSTSGTYYYTDISWWFDLDICLMVFRDEFDPANTTANVVGKSEHEFGSYELEANTDYYFVVLDKDRVGSGEFFYILAPPAPFRIQYPMTGSWFNPPTSGQGFIIDVFDSINQMFVGWYTYDIERPADDVTAIIGDPGHRWFTAQGQGPFTGNVAELDIYVTTGMIFDSGTPPPDDPVKDGTMTVEFFDCYTGQVSYDIESVGVAGDIPIERISNDAVTLCESFVDGPGQPGPLQAAEGSMRFGGEYND